MCDIYDQPCSIVGCNRTVSFHIADFAFPQSAFRGFCGKHLHLAPFGTTVWLVTDKPSEKDDLPKGFQWGTIGPMSDGNRLDSDSPRETFAVTPGGFVMKGLGRSIVMPCWSLHVAYLRGKVERRRRDRLSQNLSGRVREKTKRRKGEQNEKRSKEL